MLPMLLIKNANLFGTIVDCLIENGIYTVIAPNLTAPPGIPVYDAEENYIVPPFYNGHTHSPMNLLRGYADDLELFTWLSEHIWPKEATLTSDDIRQGALLSTQEMVHTGTVFFNDMYWQSEEGLYAAYKSGMRAIIGLFIIEEAPGKINPKCLASIERTKEAYAALPEEARSRIRLSYAPHAIYTVSGETLTKIAEQAKAEDAFIHIHASETKAEFDNCLRDHGCTPIAWLDKCGILSPKTILAHCVHLTDDDMALIASSKSIISHQPVSNYKLCSGQFDYKNAVEKHHCPFVIGTDGCASNNSLSFFDEMKLAALNAKIASGDPTAGKAEDIFYAATEGAAKAFGINGGKIEVGKVGDALILDRNAPQLTPCHNLISNIVYSADTSVVKATICQGRILG